MSLKSFHFLLLFIIYLAYSSVVKPTFVHFSILVIIAGLYVYTNYLERYTSVGLKLEEKYKQIENQIQEIHRLEAERQTKLDHRLSQLDGKISQETLRRGLGR